MKRPTTYVIRMLAFLAIVGAGLFLIRNELYSAFQHNQVLNGIILGFLVIGILYAFKQIIVLFPEVTWIEHFRRDQDLSGRQPRLLAPMATMIAERRGRLRLTTTTMRSILDGIGLRLDEGRDISRYMISLLVFLGLLGTFWGLLETVSAVIKVIQSLFVSGQDFSKVFEQFKSGLLSSLSGAGLAFSSSLFGLAGSLIVGFLELQVGLAQNRFYADLEDWLSGVTRLSAVPTNVDGDVEDSVPAYLQALLEHTAEAMDDMQHTMARGEEQRAKAAGSLEALTDRLGALTEQMRTEINLMAKLAEAQMEMKPILARLAEENVYGRQELAAEFRTDFKELANILADSQKQLRLTIEQVAGESTSGRHEVVKQLRDEFKILTRAIETLTKEAKDAAREPRPREPVRTITREEARRRVK